MRTIRIQQKYDYQDPPGWNRIIEYSTADRKSSNFHATVRQKRVVIPAGPDGDARISLQAPESFPSLFASGKCQNLTQLLAKIHLVELVVIVPME